MHFSCQAVSNVDKTDALLSRLDAQELGGEEDADDGFGVADFAGADVGHRLLKGQDDRLDHFVGLGVGMRLRETLREEQRELL